MCSAQSKCVLLTKTINRQIYRLVFLIYVLSPTQAALKGPRFGLMFKVLLSSPLNLRCLLLEHTASYANVGICFSWQKKCRLLLSLYKKKKPVWLSGTCEDPYSSRCVSPKAGAEPEEEEEAVALSKAGQEGEDQVDGQDVDQTLPPPHLVRETPPHQCPHHHGHVHQQTCERTQKNIMSPKCALYSSTFTPFTHTGCHWNTQCCLCIITYVLAYMQTQKHPREERQW